MLLVSILTELLAVTLISTGSVLSALIKEASCCADGDCYKKLQLTKMQDLCCRAASSVYDREAALMKSQQFGCLNKT